MVQIHWGTKTHPGRPCWIGTVAVAEVVLVVLLVVVAVQVHGSSRKSKRTKRRSARNDYDEEAAYGSYMNPEPGFQSGPEDSEEEEVVVVLE